MGSCCGKVQIDIETLEPLLIKIITPILQAETNKIINNINNNNNINI